MSTFTNASNTDFTQAKNRRKMVGAIQYVRAEAGRIHPLVIHHPDTGRKLLYVNPGFTIGIEGWNSDEATNLLKFLYRHAMRPEFTIRFTWREGSMALWDNRATWHYALNDYHGQRRLMHRITIEGVALH